VPPGPFGQFLARLCSDTEACGRLRAWLIEDLAQQPRRALLRRKSRESRAQGRQERHLALGCLEPFRGLDRFGQIAADVLDLRAMVGAQLVEAAALADGGQPRVRGFDGGAACCAPFEPGVLHRVLGIRPRAQDSRRDGHEPRSRLFECREIEVAHFQTLRGRAKARSPWAGACARRLSGRVRELPDLFSLRVPGYGPGRRRDGRGP
jgi:hypothetical protein